MKNLHGPTRLVGTTCSIMAGYLVVLTIRESLLPREDWYGAPIHVSVSNFTVSWSTGTIQDKWGHFGLYALIGVSIGAALAAFAVRRKVWWYAGLALTCFGSVLELTQGLLPYRNAEILDLLADVFGSVLGLVVAAALAARLRARRAKQPIP